MAFFGLYGWQNYIASGCKQKVHPQNHFHGDDEDFKRTGLVGPLTHKPSGYVKLDRLPNKSSQVHRNKVTSYKEVPSSKSSYQLSGY